MPRDAPAEGRQVATQQEDDWDKDTDSLWE